MLITTIALYVAIFFTIPQAASGQEQNDTVICSPESNTFTAKVNFSEGHLGYFEFEECAGVSPTIGLKIGVNYVFHQGDVSNWFHPLGFAYGPDGAHADQDELELGIAKTKSKCGSNFSCPSPMYLLNGNFLGDTSSVEDFGLDNYEPKFFLPLLDWIDQGTFSINLKFDDPSIAQDAFYFCHVRVDFVRFVEGSLTVNSSAC
jgi:hypothetical protein